MERLFRLLLWNFAKTETERCYNVTILVWFEISSPIS